MAVFRTRLIRVLDVEDIYWQNDPSLERSDAFQGRNRNEQLVIMKSENCKEYRGVNEVEIWKRG